MIIIWLGIRNTSVKGNCFPQHGPPVCISFCSLRPEFPTLWLTFQVPSTGILSSLGQSFPAVSLHSGSVFSMFKLTGPVFLWLNHLINSRMLHTGIQYITGVFNAWCPSYFSQTFSYINYESFRKERVYTCQSISECVVICGHDLQYSRGGAVLRGSAAFQMASDGFARGTHCTSLWVKKVIHLTKYDLKIFGKIICT